MAAEKFSDFGDDFTKFSDFIATSNNALADVLAALEQTPPEQVDGEVRKRAQRSRHILQTLQADVAKLAQTIRQRVNGQPSSSAAQEVHVHVHLHLNTENGALSSRVER